MTKFASTIWQLITRFKYQITIILGILIVGFLDEDSIIKNIELEYQISDLKEEIAKYEQRYQKDSEELKELQRDPNEISRIARERYFMKKDDEDIFVLSTDEKTSDNSIDNETVE
ncbi:MAG: septum formation initiator family protein [Prevotella sp.]|nr:septum formation initiator family protein [Prevotella sp.]MDY6318007.1 septum formation initiator family protein [Prevotella sp.]